MDDKKLTGRTGARGYDPPLATRLGETQLGRGASGPSGGSPCNPSGSTASSECTCGSNTDQLSCPCTCHGTSASKSCNWHGLTTFQHLTCLCDREGSTALFCMSGSGRGH